MFKELAPRDVDAGIVGVVGLRVVEDIFQASFCGVQLSGEGDA
jgi:hypothetical protein